MEPEKYVVEIVSASSGTVVNKSLPRHKEAAERLAAEITISDKFIVRVAPFVPPKRAASTETAGDVAPNGYRSRVE